MLRGNDQGEEGSVSDGSVDVNHFGMSQLYEGACIVVGVEYSVPGQRGCIHAFELVNKAQARVVFLTGAAAAAFQERIDFWREETPSSEEVELTVDAFMSLGQMPLMIH